MENERGLLKQADIFFANTECEALNGISSSQYGEIVSILERFAKSEAAKQYWQEQLKQPVNLEELLMEFNKKFTTMKQLKDETSALVMKDVYSYLVFNFFVSKLSGQQGKSLEEVGLYWDDFICSYCSKIGGLVYSLRPHQMTPDQLRAIANHIEQTNKTPTK